MSIKTVICPKCGKEITDAADNLCIPCFLEKTPIRIPSTIKIKYCVKCNAVFLKNMWKKPLDSIKTLFEKELESKISLPPPFILKKATILDLEEGIFSMRISKQKNTFNLEEKTNFVLEKMACPECSREVKKYIAKIQVRFFSHVKKNKKELDSFMTPFLKKVIKIEEFDRGFDYHFSNDSFAVDVSRKIARKFKAKVKETFELFSWDRQKNRPRKRRIMAIKAHT